MSCRYRSHHQDHLGRGRLSSWGADLDESHRLGTTVEYANGEIRVATLLADAFDNDNHVELCMSEPANPSPSPPAPVYEDPNGDLNVLHTVVSDAHLLSP